MNYSNRPWFSKNFQRRAVFLSNRANITRSIRSTFFRWDFQEVTTPAIQVCPGLEPHLSPFSTELIRPNHRIPLKRYLHTSPEFAMKKLLAAGVPKIYQITQVYRNRERSHTHHPEFAMLEWYRAHATYDLLMKDCEELLKNAARAVGRNGFFTWNGLTSDPFQKFERLTVNESFLKYAGIDLMQTIDDHQKPAPDLLREKAKALEIHVADTDSWEDLFFRIFMELIEPKLGIGKPTILYEYPISMAALSRPKESNPFVAERFELYVCGLELANAFGELTDRKIQETRFHADLTKKMALYGESLAIDQDFLDCLTQMPDCSGIAMGVDRLIMLTSGASHIEDTLWIPVDDSTEI